MVMDTAPQTKLRVDRAARRARSSRPATTNAGRPSSSTRRRGCAATSCIRSTTIDFIAGNAHGGPRDSRGPAGRRRGGRPLGGGGLLAGIGSVMRARKPGVQIYAAEPETAAPLATSLARGEASYFDGWQPSFVDGAGGKSVLPTMWPLLEGAGRRLDRRCRSTRSRRRCARPPSACTSSPKAPAACAIAAALSGRAGTGKIVAVVSGGNIDLVALRANSSSAHAAS